MSAAARHDAALLLVIVLGVAALVPLAGWIDARRPAFDPGDTAEYLYVAPETARRFSLGFNGLIADWYWLKMLQYIGRKVEQSARSGGTIDIVNAVDPGVVTQMIRMVTTLDPHFVGAYEFAAVLLPSVDVLAAIEIGEKGVRENPKEWYLHQQLAYIHWQRKDYRAAAEAFRRGARETGKTWMEGVALKMDTEGGDRDVAREMYRRMLEQAQDDTIRNWARGKLAQVEWFEARDRLRELLRAHSPDGFCPYGWKPVLPVLRLHNLRLDHSGVPVDPSGARVQLLLGPEGCEPALGPDSEIPRP